MTEEDLKFKNPQERKLWEKYIVAAVQAGTYAGNITDSADNVILSYRARRGQLDLDGKFKVATR